MSEIWRARRKHSHTQNNTEFISRSGESHIFGRIHTAIVVVVESSRVEPPSCTYALMKPSIRLCALEVVGFFATAKLHPLQICQKRTHAVIVAEQNLILELFYTWLINLWLEANGFSFRFSTWVTHTTSLPNDLSWRLCDKSVIKFQSSQLIVLFYVFSRGIESAIPRHEMTQMAWTRPVECGPLSTIDD